MKKFGKAMLVMSAAAFVLGSNPSFAADAPALFKEFKCNNCHKWSAQNIDVNKSKEEEEETGGKEPPDVSKLDPEIKKMSDPVSFLKEYLTKKETLHKKKHKKAFKGSDAELDTLAKAIVSGSK